VERVLLDISPYSFGVSYLGERGGVPYPHCYKPIVWRNTALPLTRTEAFMTSYPFQREVDVQVYQGEDDDALKNILVGDLPSGGFDGGAGRQPDSLPHAP
jgi:molecular chaperone DnaK (HSP70)